MFLLKSMPDMEVLLAFLVGCGGMAMTIAFFAWLAEHNFNKRGQ
jgi:hypothetical protein